MALFDRQYATAASGQCNHRQLSSLEAVERQQRREELRARQAEIAQHTGESHAVQEAEREHERQPPRLQLSREDSRRRRMQSRAQSTLTRVLPSS